MQLSSLSAERYATMRTAIAIDRPFAINQSPAKDFHVPVDRRIPAEVLGDVPRTVGSTLREIRRGIECPFQLRSHVIDVASSEIRSVLGNPITVLRDVTADY